MKIKPRYLVIKTFESNQRKEAVDIWISAVVFLVTDMLDRGRKYRTPNKTHSAKSHPAHLPILPAPSSAAYSLRGRWDSTTLKVLLWVEECSTGLKPVCPLWFCHLANSVMVQLCLEANRQTRSYMTAPLLLQLCTELTGWEKVICTEHCSSQLRS